MALNIDEAAHLLSGRSISDENAFDVLAALGRETVFGDRDHARECVIRALDQLGSFPGSVHPILQGLVREHGLFPYLRDVLELPSADHIALEAHRPEGIFSGDFVFHSEQALVYERLLAGENVVLSAPTSFGKSLVVDAYLQAADIANAVVIVPTVALMDEIRRRLARYQHGFKVITHGTQIMAERNLFVMTQERFLELDNLPKIDFFVIDEFYKLDPAHSDERSSQLNIALDRLLRTGAQFYLLGPNITSLEAVTGRRLSATFVTTAYTTVATEVERVSATKEELPDALARVCREVGPGTLIYCRSPQRVREVAQWLLERGQWGSGEDDAADWVAEAYHPDWVVARALRSGIGIHHGRLPRALGHHMVRLFNSKRLPYMLVTSTLIEGVNTTARNVVVLDHTIANRRYDYFTFSNIRGRSGRMLQHYVGRVVIFNPEPRKADLQVEIPTLSQSDKASDEVLLALPPGELSEKSRGRIARYLDQDLVSLDTLRTNRGVTLARQMEAAETIAASPDRWHNALRWTSVQPTAAQVRDLGELLFAITGPGSAVRTARQLGGRLNMLRHVEGDVAQLIRRDVTVGGRDVDASVDDNLDFARNWAQFKIPTALTAASAIGSDVLARRGLSVSDTRVFAGEIENMFLPPFTTVLEEYGLPTGTTRKLSRALQLDRAVSLDEVLGRLRDLAAIPGSLGPFEREMLDDTQSSLGAS